MNIYKSLIFINIFTIFQSIYCNLTDYQNLLIEHVKTSIQDAENYRSKVTLDILKLQGMSGHKVRHFLNNICSLPNGKYLEIGVWKGSTFISALYNNNLSTAMAIDNWSEFRGPKNIFLSNLKNFLTHESYTFYESNCFNFDLKNITNKINIYFYDGAHTEKDQYLAFTYFDNIFEDTFIAIVDDYNWKQVQTGTQLAFKDLNYHILFEQFLPTNIEGDKNSWWNGIYVAVISKNNF